MLFSNFKLKIIKPTNALFINSYIRRYASKNLPTLTDLYNRNHTYLRISLTERCNLRCTYCMPEEGVPLTPNDQLLSTEEILKLAKLFVLEGVDKIRLTGGEPSIRKDIVQLFEGLSELKQLGLKSIAMTSNGIALKRKLPDLIKNGLTTLNLSLDTLDPFQYQIMTRRNGFFKVMECLDEAERLNIQQLKINCVVMRNVNESEIVKFVDLTKERNISVRFIEYMPFDGNKWSDKKLVPYKELLNKIQDVHPNVYKVQDDKNDTTKHYKIEGHKGNFGFISSMTEHFCSTCNRLRITADGNLKVCLFGNSEISLRDLLRKNIDEEELKNLISIAVKKKKPKHAGMIELAKSKNRPMILIGDLAKLVMPHKFSLVNPSFYDTKTKNYNFLYSSSLKNSVNTNQIRTMSNKKMGNKLMLSHIDPNTGRANMVDVGEKENTKRKAQAQAKITLSQEAMEQIYDPTSNQPPMKVNKKGDVLTITQIAGIQGAKLTSTLIPLCHTLALDKVDLDFKLDYQPGFGTIIITATIKCQGRTGVEMEALTSVSIAALTIFDMCKAVDPKAIISDIIVSHKSGGKTGTFNRNE